MAGACRSKDQRCPRVGRADVAAEGGEKFAADPVFVGRKVGLHGCAAVEVRGQRGQRACHRVQPHDVTIAQAREGAASGCLG